MENTQIVIGIAEVANIVLALVGIAVTLLIAMIGGFVAVYKASASAHSDIRNQLCNIRERLTRIETKLEIPPTENLPPQ